MGVVVVTGDLQKGWWFILIPRLTQPNGSCPLGFWSYLFPRVTFHPCHAFPAATFVETHVVKGTFELPTLHKGRLITFHSQTTWIPSFPTNGNPMKHQVTAFFGKHIEDTKVGWISFPTIWFLGQCREEKSCEVGGPLGIVHLGFGHSLLQVFNLPIVPKQSWCFFCQDGLPTEY